jgi:hypothetical protein
MSQTNLEAPVISERQGGPRHQRAKTRRDSPLLLALMIGSFIVFAICADLPIWIHGAASHISTCANDCQSDPLQSTWFLSVTPYSLIHLQNPFLTNVIDYPLGANMMANTFMPLVGFLATPLMVAVGPTASFNVLIAVAFAGSATAALFVFRRWTSWTGAAYIGALFYGFSPYMVAQGASHPDLLLVPLPPLILLLLDEIVVRQKRSRTLLGLLLGLAMTAQFLVSQEVTASVLVMAVIGTLVVCFMRRREVMRRVGFATRSLAVAVVTFLVVGSYPLWVYLFGPERVTAPVQSQAALNLLSNDLISVVIPSALQRISPSGLQEITNRIAPAGILTGDDGAYIGVPLLLVLIVLAVKFWRRNGMIRFATVMSVAALVLSFGPVLIVNGRNTGIPLPFRVVEGLPFLSSVIASRFTLYVGLFVGLLLAVGLDQLRSSGIFRVRSIRARTTIVMATGVVGLVFALPAFPYPSGATAVPPFFASNEVSQIPLNGVLLTYPIPAFPYVQPMNWQAVDGLRYKLIGGYIRTGTPQGTALNQGEVSFISTYFSQCETGSNASGSPSDVRAAVNQLREWTVSTVVVSQAAPNPQCAIGLMSAALARAPRFLGGVWVWFNVQSELVHR